MSADTPAGAGEGAGLDALVAELQAVPGTIARADEPMAAHSPLRTGGPADLWVEFPDLATMRTGMRAARAAGMNRWMLHWPGQGTLVRDLGIPGMVVRPGPGFGGLSRDEAGVVRLGAATPFSALAALGPEWAALARFPSCPGALFATDQQAWLGGPLVGLRVAKGRTVRRIAVEPGAAPEPLGKSDVLMDVLLRPSPVAARSGARPRPPLPSEIIAEPDAKLCPAGLAAELEKVGLPGTRLEAWRLSTTHVGQVENLGGGTTAALFHLFRAVEDRMLRARGLTVHLGQPVVGRKASKAKGRTRRSR